MTNPKIDEQASRRPDFVPGEPVTLADGQEWQLRRPVVEFAPADNDAGFTIHLSLDDDGSFGAALAAIEALDDDASLSTLAGLELRAARMALLANYDLTTTQAGTLLRFGYESGTRGHSLREDVMGVVWGRGPKRSAGGDDAQPTPPAESPGATG